MERFREVERVSKTDAEVFEEPDLTVSIPEFWLDSVCKKRVTKFSPFKGGDYTRLWYQRQEALGGHLLAACHSFLSCMCSP